MFEEQQLQQIVNDKLLALKDIFKLSDNEFKSRFSTKIDHFAYVVQSSEKYAEIVKEWLKNGYTEYFTDFAGGEDETTATKVGVYKIPTPVKLGDSDVDIIEIIMPNIDKRRNDDSFEFEHFEISIGEKTFDQYIEENPDIPWITTKIHREKYPHLFVEGIEGLKFVQGGILG